MTVNYPRRFCREEQLLLLLPGEENGTSTSILHNIVKDTIHVHDLQAKALHCPGIVHEKLTYRHQGRDFRLTDVHGNLIHALLK